MQSDIRRKKDFDLSFMMKKEEPQQETSTGLSLGLDRVHKGMLRSLWHSRKETYMLY